MGRYAIEHLPRAAATYRVTPLDYTEARSWLTSGATTSLIRTTELIGAVRAGFEYPLEQSDASKSLRPGDEALLICLSFSVLLAWAEGDILPMPEDWRCLLLRVGQARPDDPPLVEEAPEEFTSGTLLP